MEHLLQVVAVKGRASHEALAAAVDADEATASAAVAELEAAGLVETTRLGVKVTDLGRNHVDKLYAREREAAGSIIEDVYGAFGPINDDIKQIVTDWQVRPVNGELVLNDHRDRSYDEAVIDRLRRTDARVSTALAPLTVALTRFEVYPRRLERALTQFCNGDESMLAAPMKDSYHTVWFELHEELIILSGRTRDEVAS